MSTSDPINSSSVLFGGDSSSPRSIGQINFVAQGKLEPAKFCVVDKDYPVGALTTNKFLKRFQLSHPEVLISITGSAQDFALRSSKLEQIFKGLLRAAQNTKAWIVTGGFDCGVMKHVGEAIRGQDQHALVPCIGIALFNRVTNNKLLNPADPNPIRYVRDKPNDRHSAALNPDHTHFILVNSEDDSWGREITFRTNYEDYIRHTMKIPLVLVVVNGGPANLETVFEGVARKCPIIIVEGSGRASDAIAAFVKHCRDPVRYKLDLWNQFKAEVFSTLTPEKEKNLNRHLYELRENNQYITIFNLNENETEYMDKVILQCIFNSHESSDFEHKLKLGVKWGRADLLEELFQKSDSTGDVTVRALSLALRESLKLDKPDIYELLVSKGAGLGSVDIYELYIFAQTKIKRLATLAGLETTINSEEDTRNKVGPSSIYMWKAVMRQTSSEESSLLNSTPKYSPVVSPRNLYLGKAMKILAAINPIYTRLLVDEVDGVTNTNILIWAILTDQFDLAKAVWRRTELTIHTALVACHIYKVLGKWLKDEIYTQQCTWFESAAISVLTELKYAESAKILNWKWEELGNSDALALAECAECKDFFSTSQVQHNIDYKFYSSSDKDVQLMPSTTILNIFLMLLLPNTIYYYGTYFSIHSTKIPKWYSLYSLPVAKLLTSSASYMYFLLILVLNLILLDPRDPARFDIKWYEWLLWIWLFSSIMEEVIQFSKGSNKHFAEHSNRMDVLIYVLLSIYFVLRLLARGLESITLLLAYTDVLVIATIACFLRYMTVFAVFKSLGPLFFVIVKLLNDIGKWFFIFFLFMIGFQVGIFAFTRQAGGSGWLFFPTGSMGAGFTAILGDLGDNTMGYMTKTRYGVIFVVIYSLIVQVMLANLLIAMMVNTYTAVKDNALKDWKFYRYTLVKYYTTSSTCPPPVNILFIIYHCIKVLWGCCVARRLNSVLKHNEPQIKRILKDATERMIEQEETKVKYALPSVSGSIHEQIHLLSMQQDSNRLYLERQMELSANRFGALEKNLRQLEMRMEDSEKMELRQLDKLETMEKHMKDILANLHSSNH